jgi:hypothetical protein
MISSTDAPCFIYNFDSNDDHEHALISRGDNRGVYLSFSGLQRGPEGLKNQSLRALGREGEQAKGMKRRGTWVPRAMREVTF